MHQLSWSCSSLTPCARRGDAHAGNACSYKRFTPADLRRPCEGPIPLFSLLSQGRACTSFHLLLRFARRMTNLRLQKRLAASVLKCGKKRVWLDPNESSELSMANSSMSNIPTTKFKQNHTQSTNTNTNTSIYKTPSPT